MNNQERREYNQDKIISALFRCLENKQLDDMTADEIAKEADVSKRTLYKYYSSKKEMYLALVMHSFIDLANKIKSSLEKITDEDPWFRLACIGREYIKYSIDNPTKGNLILNYNEANYIVEYEKWVGAIQMYSNQFELTPFVREYFSYHKIESEISIESLSLYLWAEGQGLAMLLMSKREWIKEFYHMDENQLIEEHLMLSKKILGEKKK